MKSKILFLSALIFVLISGCSTKNKSYYNILNFGAKADGETLNTNAIQETINSCYKNGGGTVLIPPGAFVTGPVRLLNNIDLYLAQGARLIGSPDTSDYRIDGTNHGIIYAYQARNISITGEGEIDGQGTSFHLKDSAHILTDYNRQYTRQGDQYAPDEIFPPDGPVEYIARPGMMIVIVQCENVTIKDVTLKDSPVWTIRIGDCDDVLVSGISIHNNLLIPNSDGIHCTTSRNIRISDCDIRAGDDAIIVTGFGTNVVVSGDPVDAGDYSTREFGNKTGYAENVTVSNCILQSRSAGIRVGYGSHSIRNCIFQDLVIYGSNRGLGVFSRDEGTIENIMFSNIIIENRIHSGHWWGNGEPVHVSAITQNPGMPAGHIKNICFNNIIANSETGIVIYGTEESHLEEISLKNINLTIHDSKLRDTYGGNFDLRPVADLEYAIFKHDIPGLYAGYVDRLTIEDFTLNWQNNLASYFTNGIYCENFNSLLIDGFNGRQAHLSGNQAAINIKNGSDVIIRNFIAKKGCTRFLDTEHIRGKFSLNNNELSGIQ